MTDTAAPAPTPWLELLKASIPYVGQVLVVVVTFATGWYANTHLTKKPVYEPARPAPMVALQDVDDVVRVHCGEIKLLLEKLTAPKPASRAAVR